MSESDRATLLHAAELLEEFAPTQPWPYSADMRATARALREMASAAPG